MENYFYYENYLNGGKFNGGKRYYDTWWKAEQQAKRYVKSQQKEIGGGGLYVEIYQINKNDYSKELIDTIENV